MRASAPDRADVGRAQQRLTQEADAPGVPSIDSPASARAKAALVRQLISANPQAALQAQGGIDPTHFEAASARPTA